MRTACVLLLLSLGGCASLNGETKLGYLAGATGDASFVSHPQTVYFFGRHGLGRMQSDGSNDELILSGAHGGQLAPSGMKILTWAQGQMWVVDLRGAAPFAVPGVVASDVSACGWSDTGDEVWVELRSEPPRPAKPRQSFKVGVVESARSPAACESQLPIHPPFECGPLRVGESTVAELKGCEHNHFAKGGFGQLRFSEDCSSLLFEYDNQIFVVELKTKQAAQLTFGHLFALAPSPQTR